MKKLLSLLLCIVLICLALVGCKKEKIGEYLENYKTDAITDDQIEKLNFYIITGNETSRDAMITVPQNINTYLKEKYLIELNIVYIKETEELSYKDALLNAMNTEVESNRPDIVLINSEELFNELHGDDELLALNKGEFDFYGTDFRKLNTIVDDVLLSASAIDGTYYTVPNNHEIGYYEYIVIDKTARDTFDLSNAEITAMTTEESLILLKDSIDAYNLVHNTDYDISQFVTITKGNYSDFEALKKLNLQTGEYPLVDTEENPAPELNFVNVKAYPNATKEQAFLSAFAIVKQLDDIADDPATYDDVKKATLKSHYTKCMQIIYALNTDAEFKNMLQYGYVGTNYTINKNERNENTNTIKLLLGETYANVRYEMNNIYTGNPFISYYCDDISWDEDTHDNWLKQNGDAQTPEQKMQSEAAKLSLGEGSDTRIDTNMLPTVGSYFTDVTITWKVDDTDENVNFKDGVITFNTPSKDTEVVIIAELSCCGTTYEHTFTIKLKAK